MNRPKIICHILQSVDGNLDGDFFSMPVLRPAFQAFARIREEYACDAYIAHLRHADVSYVFAGKGSLDLPLAVQKLKEKFGIEKMLLSGGGIVDWAFLQAGLIDEISLVIPPVIDGGTGLASAFDDSVFAENHSSKALSLIDVQRLDGDCIWLRYQTI